MNGKPERRVTSIVITLDNGDTHVYHRNAHGHLAHAFGAPADSTLTDQGYVRAAGSTQDIMAIFLPSPRSYRDHLFGKIDPKSLPEELQQLERTLTHLQNTPAYAIKDIECGYYPSE